MHRLTDYVAFVSGGAQGIGRGIVERLLTEGAAVTIGDVDIAAAEKTAAELSSVGTVEAVGCDVTDRSSVNAAVAAVTDRHGRLDVLVNNVGVASDVAFEETDDDEWYRQLDPTLSGAMRCIQAALPALLEAPNGGRVVSIGSVNGLTGFGNEAYSAAKAGLVNLTENLAMRYGPQGVRFNLVAPGTVRTRAWEGRLEQSPALMDQLRELYPLRRIGEPADIAAAVAYLASDDAAWVTGTVLRVDGGALAGVPSFLEAIEAAEGS